MVGKLIIGTEVDDKGLDQGLKRIKKKTDKEKVDIDVDVKAAHMEIIKNKATGVLSKLKTFGAGLAKVVSSAIVGILKIVTTIGLAFAGIMAAAAGVFILIKAIEKIKDSKEFEQIKTDLQYIIYALGQMLAPVINAVGNFIIKVLKGIISLIKTIIFYIAYLIRAWTGYDMFKNLDSSKFKDDMAKSSKSAKETAKAAKEINRQLAGFDEMNILSDNSGGSTGTSGGGAGTPSFKMEDDWAKMKVPGWLEWIAKNGDKVISILAGIAATLIAVKLGASALMGLGIGLIVAGTVQLIQDLIDMIKNFSLEKLGNVLRDISIILAGIAVTLIAIKASNPAGWIMLLISGITLLVAEILKHWDGIKTWLSEVWTSIKDTADTIWQYIKLVAINAYEAVTAPFKALGKFFYNTFKSAWDGVKKLFSKGGMVFKGITEGIAEAFKTIVNLLITGINKVIAVPFKTINGLLNTIRSVKIPVIDVHPFKGLWKKNPLPVPAIPKLAKGAIASYPGRGIPTKGGGALWAEAGQEAYLPLTDTQFLSTLGETIGKYIKVNITNVTELDGRTIARKVKEVNSKTDFLLNR